MVWPTLGSRTAKDQIRSFSLLISSSSVSAITAKSSAYSSSHGRATLNSLNSSQYQEGKTNLDFTEARDIGGSGISWAICKSAPRSRQITRPAPYHSVFYRPDALPVYVYVFSKYLNHEFSGKHSSTSAKKALMLVSKTVDDSDKTSTMTFV